MGWNPNFLPDDINPAIRAQIERATGSGNSHSRQNANLERDSQHEAQGTDEAEKGDPRSVPRRVIIECVSRRVRLADPDGVSYKAHIDCLVRAGILKDDSKAYVARVIYRQEKVKTRAEEATILRVFEVDDARA